MKLQRGFKTEVDQDNCRHSIKAKGMTLTGWAKVNGFSYNTLMTLLTRDEGLREYLPPVLSKIMIKLRKDKLA